MQSLKINLDESVYETLQNLGDREKRIRKNGKIGAATIAAEVLKYLVTNDGALEAAVQAARKEDRTP